MASPKVTLKCNECGKTWRVSADPKHWPECPKCGGADFDVKEASST